MTNATEQKQGYDVYETIDIIRSLAKSQGFYGRLLNEIEYLYDMDYEKFVEFEQIIEQQQFTDPLDVVLFFEQ